MKFLYLNQDTNHFYQNNYILYTQNILYSHPASYDSEVIASGISGHYHPGGTVHHHLPSFHETFHHPQLATTNTPHVYGTNRCNNPQPRSVAPLTSFTTAKKKLVSAHGNQNTSDIIVDRDFSKLEEMLDKDNVDDEHKCLIKLQIARIQHVKAEEEKLEEEKVKLKRQAE